MLRVVQLPRPSRMRSQSAMEYLMTYGWAILIIAVVLGALYSLGVFSNLGTVTACVAQSGFLCSQLAFNASTRGPTGLPSVTVKVGNGYQAWTNVYFAVVPQGQKITDTSVGNEGQPYDFLYWSSWCGGSDNNSNYFSSLAPGQVVTPKINFCQTMVQGPLRLGAVARGTIWAMYSVPGQSNLVSEIGVFTATASQG